jgi:hypothetical protein
MADFNNENFRLRISLEDSQGVDIGVTIIHDIELKLYSELRGVLWLQYAYPAKAGYLPMDLILPVGETPGALVAEITPAQAATAPAGVVIAQVTWRIPDADFDGGFKVKTEKGKLLNMREVVQ